MPALTIIRQPYSQKFIRYTGGSTPTEATVSLDYCDSPVWYEFKSISDNFGTPILTKTSTPIYLSDNVTAPVNNVVILPLTDGTAISIRGQVFIAKDTPTQPNHFFSNPLATLAGSLISANSLADAINQNAVLNILYTAQVQLLTGAISGSSWFVRITARYFGTGFILDGTPTFNNTFWVAGGSISTQVQASVFGNNTTKAMRFQRNNYGVFLEIWAIPMQLRATDPDQSFSPTTFQSTLVAPLSRPIPNNATFELVATLSQRWTPKDTFTFEVSRYLRGLVNDGIVNPYVFNDTRNYFLRQFIQPYFIRYGDYYNGGYSPTLDQPAQVNNITNFNITKHYQDGIGTVASADIRWATRGAMSSMIDYDPKFLFKWRRYYRTSSTTNSTDLLGRLDMVDDGIINYIPPNLSNQPFYKLRRRVTTPYPEVPYEPEPVFFVIYDSEQQGVPIQTRIQTQVTFTDNTTAISFTHTNTHNIGEYGVHYFDLALHKISALINENANRRVHFISCKLQVFKFPVWVDYSIPISYELDLNTEDNREYTKIFFVNKYGVLDSFEFEGSRSYEVSIAPTRYNKTVLPTIYSTYYQNYVSDINDPQANPTWTRELSTESIIRANSKRVSTIYSGWVNREHAEWFGELVASPQLYKRENHLNINYDTLQQTSYVGASLTNVPHLQAINIEGIELQYDDENELYNMKIDYSEGQMISEYTNG